MIDWRVVRATAHRTVGTNWLEVGAPLDQVRRQYSDYVADAKALIAEFTGWTLPVGPETVEVADREAWVDANIGQFRRLFDTLAPTLFPEPGSGPVNQIVAGAGVLAISVQVGLLLGFLSRRVLGQFDVAFLGAAEDRRVLFVEPNIQRAVALMKVNPNSFRFYLSLHETTHVAEFGAHPWLSDYLMGLLKQYLGTLGDDPLAALSARLVQRRPDSGGAIGLLMTDEQQAIFNRLQAAMSLIEGYGDYVMHQIAPRRLADAAELHHKFAERRKRRSPFEQLVFRITGLNLKLAQYAAGERFVEQIAEIAGHEATTVAWRDSNSLPTLDEIQEPARWLDRLAIASARSR
ncbi:MAG: zinc-dependent metalloprotease [Dehalococcoidia bacterium]